MESVGLARVGGIDAFSFAEVVNGVSLLALRGSHCVFCGGLDCSSAPIKASSR